MANEEPKNEIATLTKADLNLCEGLQLNEKQLSVLLKKTPTKYIKKRKGRGGQVWDYVTGGYMSKALNLISGWDNDFEIKKYEYDFTIGQVIVHGRLTVRMGGMTIVKEQFGRADIKFLKGTKNPVDFGNDLKAAATDAEKKCASKLGLASDIYAKEDFAPVQVVDEKTKEDKQREKTVSRLDARMSEQTTISGVNELWANYCSMYEPTDEDHKVFINHMKRVTK